MPLWSRLTTLGCCSKAYRSRHDGSPRKKVPDLCGSVHFYDIFSERCSDDGDVSDWTVEDGSPRKKVKVDAPAPERRDYYDLQDYEELEAQEVSSEAQSKVQCTQDNLDPGLCLIEEKVQRREHKLASGRLAACNTSEHKHRKLCNLLWEARTCWKPKNLVVAERKLRRLGIETIESLTASLLPETLNKQLEKCGEPIFPKAALTDFTRLAIRVAAHSQDASLSSSEPRSRQRLLWDTLWAARPVWMPQDLAAVDRKLEFIGVTNIATLRAALSGPGGMNAKLREVGAKGFTSDTMRALKGCVLHQNQTLRIVLQESRPLWTPLEVVAAEQKLVKVGVDSVVALTGALALGRSERLKNRLQDAGFKGFTHDTVLALRQWLGIMYSAQGSPSLG